MAGNNTPQYSVVSLRNLLEMEIPEREWIAYPFIQEKSLAILYAQRGIGKTYFAMTLGMAIASGKNAFNFTIPKSRSVLYIDGEMTGKDFQTRITNLGFGMDLCNPDTFDRFKILSNDLSESTLPNIGTPKGQEQITALLGDCELIIIDNLSALCSFGKENEAESWTPMQRWLIDLKRRGKSVLLIDHSGKDPEHGNRGTSKKQDIMDAVLSLEKPASYNITDGAKFVMRYQKSRNVAGSILKPVGFQLETVSEQGFVSWSEFKVTDTDNQIKKDAEKAKKLEKISNLLSQGKSYRDIESETGISKSTVGELAKQLKNIAEPAQAPFPEEPGPREEDLEDIDASLYF